MDLNKEWCSCNEMFDKTMCLHLVKIAIHENYLLPGMKPKSKTSRIRRREKLKISNDHESSDSDFEGKLERSEYIGTQLEKSIEREKYEISIGLEDVE